MRTYRANKGASWCFKAWLLAVQINGFILSYLLQLELWMSLIVEYFLILLRSWCNTQAVADCLHRFFFSEGTYC